MGDTTDKCKSDMMQRLHSSLGTSSSSSPKQQLHIPTLLNPSSTQCDNVKRFGIPPTSPYSHIRHGSQNFNPVATHSSSFDSLPPLSPSPFRDHDVSMEDMNNNPPSRSSFLPPRKSHRRSNSDIPCRIPSHSTTPFVKMESREREAIDDLFSEYMNLDNINIDDVLNSNMEETSRANGCSDTEGDSSCSVNENFKKRPIAPTTRHYRSLSVDSCFMPNLSFTADDSLNPPPSPGSLSRKASPTNSLDQNSASAAFSIIEFKNGEFTSAEMKKIMANDKLAEMAMSDPKRVKRILANRQSAARSKERKMRHIVELEHKVQTLQTEATTLSAQLTLLQRDMMALTNENNELKFRLQAMEQQAQLHDALNVALNGEVQRLKLAISETTHTVSDISKMQSLNANKFQQLNISHLNGTMATKPESNQ